MKAIILAAGYATRLYPLTEFKPKCLLEVGGVAILDSICAKLDALPGLDEIVLVTNARFHEQLTAWASKASVRKPIRVLNDKTTSNDNRLGAIGDLRLALREARVDTDILLLASDNLFEEGLEGFVSFAASKGREVCVALYDIGDPAKAAGKFGVLEVDPASRQVIGMEEKPARPRSSLIGMGLYYFPAEALPLIEDYLRDPAAQDAPGYFVRWLYDRKRPIFGYLFSGMWYDIGDLRSLEEANRLFRTQ